MIDLKPFCGDNDIRYYLNEPFSQGEFTYATNGHIVIRVPRRDDVPEVEAAPKCDKLFAENPFKSPAEIPEIPPAIEADCDCCNGEGTHDYACGDSPPYPCAECNETGKVMAESGDTQWPCIAVGDSGFAPKYLRLVKALPNVKFGTNGQNPARFSFDGGDGLLMPMREK